MQYVEAREEKFPKWETGSCMYTEWENRTDFFHCLQQKTARGHSRTIVGLHYNILKA